jgi:hypothetical protein
MWGQAQCGKTRLMGAFISYLHLAHGINNFFVLAPNLTTTTTSPIMRRDHVKAEAKMKAQMH